MVDHALNLTALYHTTDSFLILSNYFSATYCDDPGSPENGYKEGSMFFYPNNVTFACFQGYELQGPEEIMCTERGIWSGPVPQCKGR